MQDGTNPEGGPTKSFAKGKGFCFQSSPSRLKRFVMFDNSGGNGRVFIHPSLANELFSPNSQKHEEEKGTDPLSSNSKQNSSIICDESVEEESASRITAYRKMVSSAFSSLQMLRNSRNEDLVFGEHKLLTDNKLSDANTNTAIRSNISSNINGMGSNIAADANNMPSNINSNSANSFVSANVNTNSNGIMSYIATNTNGIMAANINPNTNVIMSNITTTDNCNETKEYRVSEAIDNTPATLYHFNRYLCNDSMASETLAFQRNEPKVFATLPSVKKTRVSETLGSLSEFFSPFSMNYNQNQNDNGDDVINNHYYHSVNDVKNRCNASDDVKNPFYHQNSDVKNHSCHEAESVSTEVWENPDDLDALLSSGEEEEDDDDEEEDDDVRSTGHSPGESSSEKGEICNEDKDDEEDEMQKRSNKRERIDDEQVQKDTNKRGRIPELHKGKSERERIYEEKVLKNTSDKKKEKEDEIDAKQFMIDEVVIARKQSFDGKPSLCKEDYRRQKIKKTMKALRRMIPGGSLLDASLVLDETIQYVKSLCDQVKNLESVRFPCQQP